MKKLTILITLFVLVFLSHHAYATFVQNSRLSLRGSASAVSTLTQNATSQADFYSFGATTLRLAQSFKVSSTGPIEKFIVKFSAVGTPGNMQFRLETGNSTEPSGTLVATGANATMNITAAGEKTVTLSSPYTPTVGSTYWIVVRKNDAIASWYASSGSIYPDGTGSRFTDLSAWVALSTDLWFKVYQLI